MASPTPGQGDSVLWNQPFAQFVGPLDQIENSCLSLKSSVYLFFSTQDGPPPASEPHSQSIQLNILWDSVCRSVSEGMVIPRTPWDKCLLRTKRVSFQAWVGSHLWTNYLLWNDPSGTEKLALRMNIRGCKYKEGKVVQWCKRTSTHWAEGQGKGGYYWASFLTLVFSFVNRKDWKRWSLRAFLTLQRWFNDF